MHFFVCQSFDRPNIVLLNDTMPNETKGNDGFFKVFFALAAIALIVVVVLLLQTANEENTILKKMGDIKHLGCRGTKGCSSKCPHVSSNDPRVAIAEYGKSIQALYDQSERGKEFFNELLARFFEKLPSTKAKVHYAIVQNAQIALVSTRRAELAKILSKSTGLTKFANEGKVTPEVMSAFNLMMALEAAASVHFQLASLAMSDAIMTLSYTHLQELPEHDRVTVKDYQAVFNVCGLNKGKVTAFSTLHGSVPSLDELLVVDTNTSIAKIVELASAYISKFHGMKSDIDFAVKYSEEMVSALEPSVIKDTFSNDLPGRVGTNEVNALITDGDYTSALIKTALEPEIASNHQKFAKERATFDSGGGVPSVRDDDNDLVKWVGIFGRPTYRRSDGTSAEKSSEPLRSIPSDNPEDLMRSSVPRLSFK